MALYDVFDISYTIKLEIQAMCNKIVPLYMLTDSMPLFYVLGKAYLTTEKRLINDFQGVKKSYKSMEWKKLHMLSLNRILLIL